MSCPEVNELILAPRCLKNGKASNDVAPELLKAASYCPDFVSTFHNLIKDVWRTRTVPEKWGESRLETLFKNKGNRLNPDMYRGLSIGLSVCKVLIKIILN